MNLRSLSQSITCRQLTASGLESLGLLLLRRTLPEECELTGVAPDCEFADYEEYHDYLIDDDILPDPEQREYYVDQFIRLEKLLVGLDPATLKPSRPNTETR